MRGILIFIAELDDFERCETTIDVYKDYLSKPPLFIETV